MRKKIGSYFLLFLLLMICEGHSAPIVTPGVDCFFEQGYDRLYKNQRIGLITNQTGINKDGIPTYELFQKKTRLTALFAPEHGIFGNIYAGTKVEEEKLDGKIPIYSLHGNTRRPTEEMMKNMDLFIFDIQDIGSRTYTYTSTLFYVMEEAAKKNIPVVVLDRPNPINGLIVDGPMLNENFRSFIGYINIPYCHGMTIGELAHFFNNEYRIGCKLHVVKMKGWKREMSYKDTHLIWIPPSPNIPEPDTPWMYPATGILGELEIVNIGIGYTLPFKIVGAPWIDGKNFARELNKQKLPGILFIPFYFKPFYGMYKNKHCEGVRMAITNPHTYRPLAVQYLLLGMLKSLYPEQFQNKLKAQKASQIKNFCLANGNDYFYELLLKEKYVAWKMIKFQEDQRKEFMQKREKYLLY
jgi:uncharacterized protein YbbC (DUF1343 family)